MRRAAMLALALSLLVWTAAVAQTRTITIGALTAHVPSSWAAQTARSQFRIGQYRIPGAGAGDAELVVFFFQGGGGSVEDNVARWESMFRQPDGKPAVGKVEMATVQGLRVTTLDVAGTYLDRPLPGSTQVTERAGYRMLNAIIENDPGPYYLRLLGPAKTVEANKAAWDELLRTLARGT